MPEINLGTIPENKEEKFVQTVLPGFESNVEKEENEDEKAVLTEDASLMVDEQAKPKDDGTKEEPKPKDNSTKEEPQNEVKTNPSKNINPEKVHNKSEFLPEIEKRNKSTLRDILMAPIRFLKFIISKVVAFLDRYTGYNDLNIKNPDVLAAERDKEAKTPSELKEKALELGAKDKNLVEKAKSFEHLLNNTYALDGRTFKVSPIKYMGFEPMLNVETVIDGKTFIDTIGLNSNCCLHTNTSSYGITNGLNAAWTKYIGNNKSREEIDNASKVLRNKVNEITREVTNSKNPVFKHIQKGIILNGVFLHISATSALKGEPVVTIRPYLVTQKAQSNSMTFPGLNTEYTFAPSELSGNNSKFADFMKDLRKTSKEYYNQSFERDMNAIIDRVIANNVNNLVKLSSPDLAEMLSVKPIGIDKGMIKLEVTCGSDREEVKLNKSGNVIGGCNNSEKCLIEALAKDTISTFVPSNILITKDALKTNIHKVHNEIKSAQSKGGDGLDAERNFRVGNSRVVISKAENTDKENIDLVVKQFSLSDKETESLSEIINVNSDEKDFQKIVDRINATNLEFAAKQSEVIMEAAKDLMRNVIVEHNLEIDSDTLESTVVDLDEKFKELNDSREEKPSINKNKEIDETSL